MSLSLITMLLRYPDGLTGLALLLLRLSSALVVYPLFMTLWGTHFNWWLADIAVVLIVLALFAGLLTRSVAALIILAAAANLYSARSETVPLLVACAGSAAALLLMGPGAYSIDAQRFGRRVIRLGLRTPDRGAVE